LELQAHKVGIAVYNFDETTAIQTHIFVVNLIFKEFAFDGENLGLIKMKLHKGFWDTGKTRRFPRP
jgi:hypothetical protein